MPHKDRASRLAYLAGYRAEHRPSPASIDRGDLPALGVIEFNDEGTKVRCHACGRWYGALNTHLRTHDLDQWSYKEAYGLKRTASLLPPATAAKYQAAAIERDQGAVGRANLPSGASRPAGLTARLQVRVEASEQRKGRTRG